MPPPKKEAAPLRDATPDEKQLNAVNVNETQPACKNRFPDWPADFAAPKPLRGDRKTDGNDAPPDGYAFADTRESEAKRLEPVTMPPGESGEELSSERLEFYRHFLGLSEWALNSEISPKVAAMWVVLKRDLRAPKDIASSLGVSTRLVTLRIAEAGKVLKELQREARP